MGIYMVQKIPKILEDSGKVFFPKKKIRVTMAGNLSIII